MEARIHDVPPDLRSIIPRHEDLHAVDHALEIDVDLPVPVVVASPLDRPERLTPAVFNNSWIGSEDAFGFVGGMRVGRAVRDVEMNSCAAVSSSRTTPWPRADDLADVRDHDFDAALSPAAPWPDRARHPNRLR